AVTRDAVADLVVDGGADGLGERLVPRRGVVERRRDGLLVVDDIVVAQRIERFGRDAGLDVRRDEIEHVAGEPAGDPHLLDFLGGLGDGAHLDSGRGRAAGNGRTAGAGPRTAGATLHPAEDGPG